MALKRIKTKTGFEMEIDENIGDDMELIDTVAEVQAGNLMLLPQVVRKIFGDYKQALYDHLRLPEGRVPLEAVSEEIASVFEELGEKNS